MDGLSRGARRCLKLLESYARRSGLAFPFQATMATSLGVGIRQVKNYIRKLREGGYITVTKRQHSSAVYKLTGKKFLSEFPSECTSGQPIKSLGSFSEVELLATERLAAAKIGGYTSERGEVLREGIGIDQGTIRRIAQILGTVENYRRFENKLVALWPRMESWGLAVTLARDMMAQPMGKPPGREERATQARKATAGQ